LSKEGRRSIAGKKGNPSSRVQVPAEAAGAGQSNNVARSFP
jgi:hypothetical protein